MKIKAKNKKSTTKKPMYPNGGFIKYDGGSNLSQDWDNSQQATKSGGVSMAQANGYAGMAAGMGNSLLSLNKDYKPVQPQGIGSNVFQTSKQIAMATPIGGFVAAGDMMGKGFQMGTDKAYQNIESGKGNKGVNEAGAKTMSFFKGFLDPEANQETIWNLKDKGKLKTGEAIGLSVGNFLGLAGPIEAELQRKYKYDLHPELKKQETPVSFPTANSNIPQDNTQQMAANGGFGDNKSKTSTHLLEKYKVLPHSQLNPNFANAHLDGKPIQLEKNETIFRAANGGDYAFSPNLMDGDKTIAERSIQIDKKYTKPYFDKVAEDTKKLALNDLVKKNESLRVAKEEKGLPKAEWGEFGPNIDNSTTNYKQAPQVPQWTQGQESQTTVPQIRGTEWGDNSVSVNPNVYTEYFKNDSNLNPNNYPLQNKYKPDLTIKTNSKTPIKTENNLTPGDYVQLAGSAVAPLANLANYFRKPEKIKGHFDRTPITPNQQGVDLNPMFLAQNTATKGISEGTSSDAVRRANLANVVSGTQQNIGNALLQNKLLNNTLRGQYEDRLAGRTRANAEVAHRQDVEQSQTNAVRQSYLNTAASQLGQGMVDTGKFKNQGLTNEMSLASLNALAANYGIDAKTLQELFKNGLNYKFKG